MKPKPKPKLLVYMIEKEHFILYTLCTLSTSYILPTLPYTFTRKDKKKTKAKKAKKQKQKQKQTKTNERVLMPISEPFLTYLSLSLSIPPLAPTSKVK